MKPYLYTLIAAAAVTGLASAQTTAYTTPVGYNTQTLVQGYNVSGLTLQTPTVAAGVLEGVVGTALTDDELTLTPVAGKTYVLEITASATPALVGTIQDIADTAISGTTITTNDDLGALGLAAGDSYALRVAPTLEDIFTTIPRASGGVLDAALSSGSSDIIWIPNGSGGYVKYYLRSNGEFRNVATNLASPNVPIIYADGLLIQKKNTTTASLTVSGEVKTTGTNSVAVQGYNVLSAVAPVGLNLFNAGLEDDLTAALSAGSADIVWVQQPNLSYIQYFRRSGTGAGWRVSGTTTTLTDAQAQAVSLNYGFLIQRKLASPAAIDLNVPASYSGL